MGAGNIDSIIDFVSKTDKFNILQNIISQLIRAMTFGYVLCCTTTNLVVKLPHVRSTHILNINSVHREYNHSMLNLSL